MSVLTLLLLSLRQQSLLRLSMTTESAAEPLHSVADYTSDCAATGAASTETS
jgi:hypothetical protein